MIAPSHMPRMNLTAKSAPKDLQAACAHNATDHTKMLILHNFRHCGRRGEGMSMLSIVLTSSIFQRGSTAGQGFADTRRQGS